MSVEPRITVALITGQKQATSLYMSGSRCCRPEEKKIIGDDLKTTQYGWPLGMPLIRKLEPGFWEVRSRLQDRIPRVIFTVEGDTMVLLHRLIRNQRRCRSKTCNWPDSGFNHWLRIERGMMNEKHLGSSLDDFLFWPKKGDSPRRKKLIATKHVPGVSDCQTDGRTAAIQDGNGAPHEHKPCRSR